ncbi:TolC family protein [Clostridium sp. AF02-29]|uniref:TolC family protein n=1 Tax=Clostridium sp. AF02-29 TaxID=2292993 RepID=UPI002354A61B|nr:TolC family protein [Clostridium sp. AF02-29]
MMRNLKGKWMNAEAGTEQKMRKGQERDRSGASALDVHPDGHNVKRIGKSRLSRSIGIALAACILVSSPAQAAKTPLISGTESDSDSEADGPALEDGTITENSADNTIASQSGSYTEEQLADSVIEYGELEALVRRGNGTAVSADYSYQDSLAVYQEAYDAMISGARDMNYKADAGGDEALIGTYERNAQTLSMAAKQYKKSLTSLNSASSRASRNRTVWQVVKTAQIQWGTCRQLQDEVGAAAKTAENYQAQVDRKERELAAGLCTETDLLQAQKNLLSAQTALQSTTDQANKALRQLAILLGKSGTSITLGEIPAVSATELASMNLDADRAAAVVASSSVKSARRSSATGDAARKLRHQQIEEAESAASASADEQYAEIAALSLERDAAQAAYQSAEKTYGATQIKYQSGAINKATYLQGEASYLQKKAELETAEISLRTAYDAYEWMLKGVA